MAVNAVVISLLEVLLPKTFCKDFIDAYNGTKYSYSSGKLEIEESPYATVGLFISKYLQAPEAGKAFNLPLYI